MISTRTINTITLPLIPSPLSKKSGVFEPKVAEQIEGGDQKPAQRPLKTERDSS